MSANCQLLLGNVATAASGGNVNAAAFDGTNDWLSKSGTLTGLVDGTTGIFSCWVRLDGGDASRMILINDYFGYGLFYIERTTGNKFKAIGYTAAAAKILDISTTSSYTSSSTWLHVLMSWDLGATPATNIYINDVSDKTVTTATSGTIDYKTDNQGNEGWDIGATNGSNKLNGALAEFYFAPNQYLDFSTESNRRKFISSTGIPVSLGSDGSTPTSTAPLVYLKSAYSSFGTNSGTGGNFTVNGTLGDTIGP